VEVISKTEARIIGSRTDLLRALASSDDGNFAAAGGVLDSKPKWRARKDSNFFVDFTLLADATGLEFPNYDR